MILPSRGTLPIVILLFCLACAMVGGCAGESGDRKAPEYASLWQDPQSVRVDEIRRKFVAGGNLTPEEGDLLMTLAERYPHERELNDLLDRVLVRREDWNALIRLRSRTPAGERTAAQRRDLAKLFVKAQRFDEAAVILDALVREYPDDIELLWLSGYAGYYRGDYAGAIETFETNRARLLPAGHEQSLLLAGLSHFQLDHLDEAIAMLREYTRLEPDDASGLNGLARALVAVGRDEEAEPLFARMNEIHRRHNETERRQSWLANRVRALNDALAEKRSADSEAIIQEILPVADAELQARLLKILADIYTATGREDEARDARARAASLTSAEGGTR